MDHERCVGCGYDGSDFDDQDLLDGLHLLGPAWTSLFSGSGPLLRVRPDPSTWSAVEYAAHSRDITALHAWAVEQALWNREPVLPDLDADELIGAAAAGYADEDPSEVTRELGVHAHRLADVAGQGWPESWERGITIGGSRSDVRRLLEHGLHDSRHHLGDVRRGLVTLEQAAGPGNPAR